MFSCLLHSVKRINSRRKYKTSILAGETTAMGSHSQVIKCHGIWSCDLHWVDDHILNWWILSFSRIHITKEQGISRHLQPSRDGEKAYYLTTVSFLSICCLMDYREEGGQRNGGSYFSDKPDFHGWGLYWWVFSVGLIIYLMLKIMQPRECGLLLQHPICVCNRAGSVFGWISYVGGQRKFVLQRVQ